MLYCVYFPLPSDAARVFFPPLMLWLLNDKWLPVFSHWIELFPSHTSPPHNNKNKKGLFFLVYFFFSILFYRSFVFFRTLLTLLFIFRHTQTANIYPLLPPLTPLYTHIVTHIFIYIPQKAFPYFFFLFLSCFLPVFLLFYSAAALVMGNRNPYFISSGRRTQRN